MKKSILYIMFACLFVSTGWTSYTYEVDSYGYIPSLHGTETLLMFNEGGTSSLIFNDSSSATILSTSTLERGIGGVWEISLANSSHLDMSGGQVHLLSLNNEATVLLSGGLIQQIWSYQWVPYTPGRDGVPVPNIKLYYSGVLPTYNETTDILTGLWGNGTGFSIYLHDVAGYDPVIENIEFIPIPEPASFLIVGLGIIALRRSGKKDMVK